MPKAKVFELLYNDFEKEWILIKRIPSSTEFISAYKTKSEVISEFLKSDEFDKGEILKIYSKEDKLLKSIKRKKSIDYMDNKKGDKL